MTDSLLTHYFRLLCAFFAEHHVLAFGSIPFWVCFLAFLAGYTFFRGKRTRGMMAYVTAFSLFFYYKANGALMLLLPTTALATWYLVGRMRTAKRRKGWLLALTVVLNLLPLLYFKYANFLGTTWAALVDGNFAPWDIALPIGISFYTFQGISYAVDVYRGRFRLEPTLLEYTFYLTFFPLILAGPITRAGTLIPQLRRSGGISSRTVWLGLWLFTVGLLKKGVAADYLAQFVNLVFDEPTAYSGFENLMAVAGYTLQIYLDFSGYSDMAIGLAAMLGFRLRDNFNFPYRATSVAAFWRRWHISLSTWFRDYFYIPLGGNRRGRWRTYLNNFLTMVLAGVWHGSTWMFAAWGALHGAALVVNKAWRDIALPSRLREVRVPKEVNTALSWTLTMVFLMCSWVFFRAPDTATAMAVFSQIFTNFDLAYLPPFVAVRTAWCAMLVVAAAFHLLTPRHAARLAAGFVCAPWGIKLLIFAAAVQLAVTFGQSTVQPFIYAQF
ncbi:MAG: MBOAT family protein [Bacteroidaceae bacterium]|nr:MBOAT family protein [Bacteroidaceae bacterium]